MKRAIFFAVLSVLLKVQAAVACPLVANFPDYNCDGKVSFVFVGDSLVYGFGDLKNGNKGGYPLRLKKAYPDFEIVNLGEQGQRTFDLLGDVNEAFQDRGHDTLKKALLGADVVVLDLGRNDRWLFGTPLAAYRNLKKTASLIKSKVAAEEGIAPLVITAVIMLPNRGSQGPWVKELDSIILKSNTKSAPADLRFDLVSKRLLGSDQIHPTSQGYDALAKAFQAYLKNTLRKKLLDLRPDADDDGIYDVIETAIYHTDPTKLDTDGDGVSDGDEVFKFMTDPLAAPVVPTATPTPTPTATATP